MNGGLCRIGHRNNEEPRKLHYTGRMNNEDLARGKTPSGHLGNAPQGQIMRPDASLDPHAEGEATPVISETMWASDGGQWGSLTMKRDTPGSLTCLQLTAQRDQPAEGAMMTRLPSEWEPSTQASRTSTNHKRTVRSNHGTTLERPAHVGPNPRIDIGGTVQAGS
ncbi:hypothetical protein R1flu_009396 [Riccia fluitans]|uniref:Uncharacterized protein n=1 Tax=Riccia fluitans TaxID=41844 RepID=A0ABD1Z4H6_9MARC